MKDFNYLSNFVTLAVGVSFLMPDVVWNPAHGWLKQFTFIGSDALETPDKELDPVILCGLQGTGVILTSLSLFQFFWMKKKEEEVAVIRYKLALVVTQLAVFVQGLLFADSKMVNKNVILFWFVYNIAKLLGMLSEHQQKMKMVKKDLTKPVERASMVSLAYILPLASTMLIVPQWFASQLYELPQDQEAWNDAQIMSIRTEGAAMLATCLRVWDTRRTPLKQLCLLASAMYMIVLVRSSLKPTVKQGAFNTVMAAHYLYFSFLSMEFSSENTSLKGIPKAESQTSIERDTKKMK